MFSNTFAILPFIETFKRKVDELSLSVEQIYNVNKSGLFRCVLPNKTYVHRKKLNASGRKLSKEGINFMPAEYPRPYKNVRLPLVYKNQHKALVRSFHGPNDTLKTLDDAIQILFMPPNCIPLLQLQPKYNTIDRNELQKDFT